MNSFFSTSETVNLNGGSIDPAVYDHFLITDGSGGENSVTPPTGLSQWAIDDLIDPADWVNLGHVILPGMKPLPTRLDQGSGQIALMRLSGQSQVVAGGDNCIVIGTNTGGVSPIKIRNPFGNSQAAIVTGATPATVRSGINGMRFEIQTGGTGNEELDIAGDFTRHTVVKIMLNQKASGGDSVKINFVGTIYLTDGSTPASVKLNNVQDFIVCVLSMEELIILKASAGVVTP